MTFDAGRIRHDDSLMHYARASNGTAIPSNWIRSTDGTTAATWRPESAGTPSYGSNSNDVSFTDAPGASSLSSRADHVHRGVTSLAHSSNTYTGPVVLETEGSLYIVRSAANTYRFGSTGSGGGGSSSLTVEEVDGSPTDSAVTKIVFPNGTLGIASHVATYTPSGGGGPSDYVSGASGTGHIVIPGLAGSADIPPASPNGSDDEFDTTDTSDPMTGWTTLQTPTTHDINSTIKSHYYVKKSASNATTAQVGIYKSWSPSAGDTVTCKVSDAIATTTNFQRACFLAIGASTPTAQDMISYTNDSSGPRYVVMHYTALGTFGSNLAQVGAAEPSMFPLYFRIKCNSSTSFDFMVSGAGLLFTTLLAARNPGLTVGSVLIGIEPANTTFDGEALFDWVRFNWTPGT